ncbi:MAG: hypothetical protein DRP79_01535 [Planctomycetota bacterium]|nr:MAG: hypothetical protein DRP79_01535 [Planctomycetota bacterium]
MNEQLRLLRKLQQVNDKIREFEDEKAALGAALGKRRKDIRDHQRHIDELAQKVLEAKKKEDQYNLNLKANEADINKLLVQLTQAKTNEGYAGLNKRIEEEQKQNSALEDSILQLMTDIEEMERRNAAAKKALDAEQEEFSRFEAKVKADQDAIDGRIREYQDRAAEIEKSVEGEILDKYHRLYERKDGHALAGLDRSAGVCLGCNLPVTKQDINLLLADNGIIFCKSCGRILYIPEDEEE